jgi:hypothetical protein
MKLFAAILITTFFLPTARAVEPAPARLIGYYSSMQVEGADDPHFVSGYDIALFQREAETIGHVGVAIGTPEPTGATLKNLAYDPKKKLLTFTAEYSSGLATNPIKGAPDREALQVLTFRGVVRPESISGKMGVKDFYCVQCKPVFKRVKLKRIKEMGRTGELQMVPWESSGH